MVFTHVGVVPACCAPLLVPQVLSGIMDTATTLDDIGGRCFPKEMRIYPAFYACPLPDRVYSAADAGPGKPFMNISTGTGKKWLCAAVRYAPAIHII